MINNGPHMPDLNQAWPTSTRHCPKSPGTLADVYPEIGAISNFGPKSGKSGSNSTQSLAEVDRNVGSMSGELGRTRTDNGRTRPDIGRLGATCGRSRTNFGQSRAKVGRDRPRFGRDRPSLPMLYVFPLREATSRFSGPPAPLRLTHMHALLLMARRGDHEFNQLVGV